MKISISALSIAYGLTPEALRYYEEKGLLTPQRTSSGGFRKFSSVDIQMLGIIKSLQRQGFSLDEIRRIAKEGLPLSELISMMDEKRGQMGEQIVMLNAIRNRLTSCTDLLRDHERLLMQPRICQGCAAYLADYDSVPALWQSVPKSPLLKELIDALPLTSYCTILPLSCLKGESSAAIRERVIKARKIQEERFAAHPGIHCNAQMESNLIHQYAEPDEQGLNLLRNAMTRLNLSARAYDRILKVSRTIADLEGSEEIKAHHLAEAISYRSLDRESWGG